MKNLISIILFFAFVFTSTGVLAVTTVIHPGTASSGQLPNGITQEETSRITSRVNEIRTMRSEDISSGERSKLKNELRGMKKQLSGPGTGVYLSSSALILILILLIILI